ncbi:MAG: DmsC/YnfH family molybdoenzyme membrane anchor subunit [Pseudomonadota bacterium]
MHPAPSIIVFTVFSGLGFGLLAWLGAGFLAPTGWAAFAHYALAFALAGGGLIAATFHLANPRNAVKSFSQWRTSWLSREAVLAAATMAVMGLQAALSVFAAPVAALGWLGAGLAVATVYATAMIYGQLRSVPRWHQPLTPVLFVVMALGGGALLAGQVLVALILLPLAALVQIAVWLVGDGRFAAAGSTMESATGLGSMGRVRLLEPPHTGENYLLREMVHVVARRHAVRLRWIALAAMAPLPVLMLLATGGGTVAATLAALCHLAGALAARWLFFAEAEHVVGLYYGKR